MPKNKKIIIDDEEEDDDDIIDGVLENLFPDEDSEDGFDIDDHFDVVIDTCAYKGIHIQKAIAELNFDYYLNFGPSNNRILYLSKHATPKSNYEATI